MSDTLYLSKAVLKRAPDITPLIKILQPPDKDQAISTDHRLMWSLMPHDIQQKFKTEPGTSPFLWRREDKGCYYVLGPRPAPESSLFEIETKPYEAHLRRGDRLSFILRLNATVDRREGGRTGTRRRVDVAMDLLKDVALKDRADLRQARASEAVEHWLKARAQDSGFTLEALTLEGYRPASIPRQEHRHKTQHGHATIGIFDLRGLITIENPDVFLERQRQGFGRAKAFGCGLMLVRRTD